MLPDTWRGWKRPHPVHPSWQTATTRTPGEPPVPDCRRGARAAPRETQLQAGGQARRPGGFGCCGAVLPTGTSMASRRPPRWVAPPMNLRLRLDRQRSAQLTADSVQRCPLARRRAEALGELRRFAGISSGELAAGNPGSPAGYKICNPCRRAMARRASDTESIRSGGVLPLVYLGRPLPEDATSRHSKFVLCPCIIAAPAPGPTGWTRPAR